jgi:hypothetical protein
MSAEIVGIDKIVKYISKFDFKKIKLSKGTDTVYIRRTKDGESQNDLIADFTDWADEFITPNNFRDYKIELFGSYSDDPNAKLSPVVKSTVAFNERQAVAGDHFVAKSGHQLNGQSIDVDKYVTVATENATLRAQLERLEEKMDEMLEDDDESDDVGSVQPETIGQALNAALISKLDTIIDAVIMRFALPNNPTTPNVAINGVDDVLTEFREIHPDIDSDLARLLTLAKTKPDFFKMLIVQLRNIV